MAKQLESKVDEENKLTSGLISTVAVFVGVGIMFGSDYIPKYGEAIGFGAGVFTGMYLCHAIKDFYQHYTR